MFQGDSSEFWGGEGLEDAIERSHGGARGSDDDDFGGGLRVSLMDGDKDWGDAGGLTIFEEMVGEEHKGVCLKVMAGRVLIYLT